ncbi:MAG: hypothetical protein VYA30_05025 [Myxococcota bacterium]|nr:hypothetical protein [Myxococcota bacterium]
MIGPTLAELHRHLDGSIRSETLAELAAAAGVHVPETLLFKPGMGLDDALSRFGFILTLLQDAASLTRVAHEICQDAKAEEIEHLEVRFAPQLHGLTSLAKSVDAVVDGLHDHGSLILCLLYGDPPELLENLVDLARDRPRVVGIDVAGGPASGHRWGLRDYGAGFSKARRLGLGRTIHAGEGRSVAEIKFAIEHLYAQRIGHGVTLLDDPNVVDLVRTRGVTIEACPTSNWHTGVIGQIAEHPLKIWLELGVSVTLCTDNTLLSDTTLPEEYSRVTDALSLSQDEVEKLRLNGVNGRFQC